MVLELTPSFYTSREEKRREEKRRRIQKKNMMMMIDEERTEEEWLARFIYYNISITFSLYTIAYFEMQSLKSQQRCRIMMDSASALSYLITYSSETFELIVLNVFLRSYSETIEGCQGSGASERRHFQIDCDRGKLCRVLTPSGYC